MYLATRTCRTTKRAFHFYLRGVVRRIHAAALHVRPAAAAADAAVYSQFADEKASVYWKSDKNNFKKNNNNVGIAWETRFRSKMKVIKPNIKNYIVSNLNYEKFLTEYGLFTADLFVDWFVRRQKN